MNLPKPVKYGKGRTISTAVDVFSKSWRRIIPFARMVLDYRQLTKLKSTYVGALPVLIIPRRPGRLHTTFGQTELRRDVCPRRTRICRIPIRLSLDAVFAPRSSREPGHVPVYCRLLGRSELRLLAHFCA